MARGLTALPSVALGGEQVNFSLAVGWAVRVADHMISVCEESWEQRFHNELV